MLMRVIKVKILFNNGVRNNRQDHDEDRNTLQSVDKLTR